LANSGAKLKKTVTLQDCLNEFMKEETMGDADTWYCPSCKEHKKIKKKLDIWSVPEVIAVMQSSYSELTDLILHCRLLSST
jgi:ubiquitin carboxyl-terminal hydrolase 4/11/15